MQEVLWPTRNVSEYAYCPRLFYYMAVEGVFLPSADTEEGQHVHRRVDQPSKVAARSAGSNNGDQPKIVRSLALSSAKLNLTATLDLASPACNRSGVLVTLAGLTGRSAGDSIHPHFEGDF